MGQGVTNGMRGTDFSRPDKPRWLATTLTLGLADLTQWFQAAQPVVAFGKKADAKTTDAYVYKAMT